jgi:hypothetical protein
MYLDVKCLVTTAIGCLVDSVAAVQGLAWVHRLSGAPCTYDQVTQAWTTVKGATNLARLGGGAFAQLTDVRLTPDASHALVVSRAAAFEVYLRTRFPDYDGWPADAQLGLLSCAWAAGPGWVAPHFDAAARALDWMTCAGPEGDAGADPSCRGAAWLNDTGNPGLRPRNLAAKICFENAALTTDPANLVWPARLTSSPFPDYLATLDYGQAAPVV